MVILAPHVSQTDFSCVRRYLCYSNEVCVLNPLPQSLHNLGWPFILSFRSSLWEIFLLSWVVEPCLWHVLEMSVLSSVVSSKISDVSGMSLFFFCCLIFSFWCLRNWFIFILLFHILFLYPFIFQLRFCVWWNKTQVAGRVLKFSISGKC